jgi:hypothetical protein
MLQPGRQTFVDLTHCIIAKFEAREAKPPLASSGLDSKTSFIWVLNRDAYKHRFPSRDA